MRRRRQVRTVRRGVRIGAMLALLCSLVATARPADAGTFLAVTPTFPAASTVGQTGVPASLTINNVSTPPESGGTVTLTDLTLVPSCGTLASGTCPGASTDPGVYRVTEAVGGSGACAGRIFSITTIDAAQGKLRFTASPSVTLGAPSTGDACRIDLKVDVLKRPTRDAQPDTPGQQTAHLASVTGVAQVNNGTGTGTGATTSTVNRATPTLATLASPQSAIVGQTITDTATVVGVSGAPAPTNGIVFTVYADPVGATPCSGPSQNLGLVGLAPSGGNPPISTATSPPVTAAGPGTYRFVASYVGDANYEFVPTTPCGAPGENVTVNLPGGRYTPLTPARILDTRTGIGGLTDPVGPGSTVAVRVAGRGGVPASGVSAVAMNVTATSPTSSGFLTVHPGGTARPLASNLNFNPDKTVPNLVVVALGSGGTVNVFNSAGTTEVIIDVAGWFSGPGPGAAGHFVSLAPARILDTRTGTGAAVARVGPGATLDLQVAGAGGVPATGAGAVAVNVAVTNTSAAGYLTVHPTGEARPLASNLNWAPGNTVANRVLVKLGSNGRISLYNAAGETDVIVDVNGWLTDATGSVAAGTYTAVAPARILDTRGGAPVGAGSTVEIQVTGQGGVPASGVSAVILNATVVTPAAAGWLTIFPTGFARPLASDLNYASGEIRPNLVVVKVGLGGKVSLYTSAAADVVFDVAGWFT